MGVVDAQAHGQSGYVAALQQAADTQGQTGPYPSPCNRRQDNTASLLPPAAMPMPQQSTRQPPMARVPPQSLCQPSMAHMALQPAQSRLQPPPQWLQAAEAPLTHYTPSSVHFPPSGAALSSASMAAMDHLQGS